MDALDGIAAKAGKSKKAGDLKKLAAELEAAAGKLEGADKEHGEVYVQLAKKALEKVRRGGVLLTCMGMHGGGVEVLHGVPQGPAWGAAWACMDAWACMGHGAGLQLAATQLPPPTTPRQGAEWFAAERVRLERLMSSGAVGPSKVCAAGGMFDLFKC